MKLIKYSIVIFVMLLILFSCQSNEKHVLVKKKLFSEEGLKKWNASTETAIDSYRVTYGSNPKIKYIQNSLHKAKKDPSPNHSVLLREKYFEMLKASDSFRDSIPYDTFFLVEWHKSGEEISMLKFMIANEGDSSTCFITRYSQGNWLPLVKKSGKLVELNAFIEEVPSNTENYYWGGQMEDYLIITKLTGESKPLTTKVFDTLSKESYSKLQVLLPYCLYRVLYTGTEDCL